MSSSEFSIPSLSLLMESSQHDLVSVYTKPPKPAKRGHKLTKNDVHIFAETHNIIAYTPTSLRDEIETIQQINPDLIIVASYGLFLPQNILNIPKYGCINIHPSLLPKFRGPSPIQSVILSGDEKTGITIMKMSNELDAGDILLQKEVLIDQKDNHLSLHNKLSELSSTIMLTVINNIEYFKPISQNHQEASYSQKIYDYQIDWHDEAELICRKIRALYPKCFFTFNGKRIKVLKAYCYKLSMIKNLSCGSLINNHFHIQCKNESILVPQILQMEGKKPCSTEDFQRGYKLNELTILI